jgi:16S rRNA (guanine(527)-N(7))-methyltransferase RsmG
MADPLRDPLAPLAEAIRVLTGRAPSNAERERFARYLDLLVLWNRTHRMTALTSPAQIGRLLFQDSLLLLPLLPRGQIELVDIGAGAGFPGMPLRIVQPRLKLTLIEARRKRVSFLATVRRELGLEDVEILEGRAEDLIEQRHDLLGKFDVAVSRAVAKSKGFLSTISDYLKPGGLFITPGPPKPGRLPSTPASLVARWEQLGFPALGLARFFLVAAKNARNSGYWC